MSYEYKACPIYFDSTSSQSLAEQGSGISEMINTTIAQWVAAGYEFHSIEVVQLTVAPGCLSALFGGSPHLQPMHQIIFKKQAAPSPPPLLNSPSVPTLPMV